jgi:hypothetical protein
MHNPDDRSFIGHPRGLGYIAFAEAWERIGGLLEKMPATQFWLLHATLAGTAGVIFLVAGKLFGHLLAPGDNASPA